MSRVDSGEARRARVPERPLVRRLYERDRARLYELLNQDEGYALFLRAHLEQVPLTSGIMRYWGQFQAGELEGALKLAGSRAAIYAPVGVDILPLAKRAARERVTFTMGRPDLVDTLLSLYDAQAIERRDDHYLALCANPVAPIVLRDAATIRRATICDLDALVDLYRGTDGFEQTSDDLLRRTLTMRTTELRTYIVEHDGRVVAGASTSAETPTAAMIGAVWTAPGARNRGFATAVVGALVRELAAEGMRSYLFYLRDNAAAARVYVKDGFSVVGEWSVAYLTFDAVPRRL